MDEEEDNGHTNGKHGIGRTGETGEYAPGDLLGRLPGFYSEPFYGFSIIIEGMMLGVGKTKEPFVFNIIGMWGIRIAGTFVCTQMLGLGLVSAWGCMIAHNLFLFGIFWFVI